MTPEDRYLIELHTWFSSLNQRIVGLKIKIGDHLFKDWSPPVPRGPKISQPKKRAANDTLKLEDLGL